MRKTLLLLATSFIFIFSGCKKESTEQENTAALGQFSPYISSMSSGILSKTDAIIINFNSNFEDVKAGDDADSKLYNITPKVKLKAVWQSQSVLMLEPAAHLQSGAIYTVAIQLDRLFELPEDFPKVFSFPIQTIPLSYAVEFESLENPDANDYTKVLYKGSIKSSDWVANEAVEKMLSASFNGADLSVSYEHGANQKVHPFVIKDITRQKKDQQLKINWTGKPIGVENDGSTSIEIPSKDSFKLISATVERAGDAYVNLVFSDPISPNQAFEDAIKIANYKIRATADKNTLKVYPLSGVFSGKLLVKVLQNLKNARGLQLDKPAAHELQVSTFKPQIKSLAGNGHIIPSSNKMVLPLQLVGLKAIQVTVIRIFPNNILQYYQENDLGGSYDLRRVGRPVIRKVIPLIKAGVTDYYSWNNISIDLGEIFKVEPGAIYQVKVDFTKEMAVYNCVDMDTDEQVEETTDDAMSLDWDDTYDYYYGDYDWNERDNPCHAMYYRQNREIEEMIYASDIGLTAKLANNGQLHLLTTNLVSSAAMNGVDVKIFDYQNQVINSGKTDANGFLKLPVVREPFLAVAIKDNQYTYLKLNDGDALPLSNFDVAGATAAEGLKGLIYGERGVWRPGDTLHLGFILEDQYQKVVAGSPVFMELYNPQGQLFTRIKPQLVKGPIYYFEPHTEEMSPTGNWLAKVHVGGTTFSKNVKIETVKPNRLKIDLDFGSKLLKSTEGNFADVSVRWLHGAVARNLQAKFEMSASISSTRFDDFLAYNFDDLAKDYYSAKKVIFDNKVDNNGNARFAIKVENGQQAPGMLQLRFSGKVFEEGGDFSISNTSVLYSPYASYAGLNVPSTEDNSSNALLYTNKDNQIAAVNVDENGSPLANKSVKIDLYKLDWRWWWDHGGENVSNYVSSSYNKPVKSMQLTTDAKGKAIWNLNINNQDWGRYYIRVKDLKSGHTSGEVVYFRRSDWYGSMAKSMGGADLLNFRLSKDKVQSGEKFQVIIPGGKDGHAYISVETGKAVLQEHYIPLADEETVYELQTTAGMAPNIYVHVSVVQPHDQIYNDLPIRLYGVRNILVEDAATVLQPELKIPQNAQPGETIQLQVSEGNGQAMAYTIALVDEGLLGLTNYKTPAPWHHFYAREALGVKTWDMFKDVMSSFTGKYGHLLAIGGDEAGPLEEKSESRFKPVVGYLGPFYLESGAQKTHSYTIPQYIGELRVMLIAADKKGKYGATDKALGINQPLMMLATLPRVMGPGEVTYMPVTLFAKDPSIKKATITVTTEGKLVVSGENTKTVTVDGDNESIVYIPIKAAQALGSGKVHIKATSGKHEAIYDVAMQVRPSNPMMLSMADKLIEENQSWETAYQPLGMPGTNQASIELSTLPALNLDQRADYLIRYPHGCVEQTTSSVFAQLFLTALLEVGESRNYEIQQNINAAIGRLRNFQTSDGGFAYWPGNLTSNEWGSNYAGHFLQLAKSKGYEVPKDMLQQWKGFQTKLANEWVLSGNRYQYGRYDLIQAYRLYTLALSGDAAMSAMNRMRELNNLSIQAKWMLANAYAQAGHADVANALIANTKTTIDDYRELGGTFGSSIRDEAIILETLSKLGRKKEAFEVLNRIAQSLGEPDKWMSTQTTAYCLIGVAAYTADFPASSNLKARITVDGKSTELQAAGYFAQYSFDNPDSKASFKVESMNGTPVYARLLRQGIPIEGIEFPENTNLGIEVAYFDTDNQVLDINQLKQGTDFKAIVTVSNPGTKGSLEQLALTHIFPSGWEILNSRLAGDAAAKDGATYKDIRDDRVSTYFDLAAGKSKRFEVNLNASYQGSYYLPAVQAEAMYDKRIFASEKGKWIKIVK